MCPQPLVLDLCEGHSSVVLACAAAPALTQWCSSLRGTALVVKPGAQEASLRHIRVQRDLQPNGQAQLLLNTSTGTMSVISAWETM